MHYATNDFQPGSPGVAVEASLRRDRSGTISAGKATKTREAAKPLKGLKVRKTASEK